MGLAGQPEEEAQDDGNLVEEAGDGLEEVEQLSESELIVRRRHGRSCASEVCADGSASVDILVVLVCVVGLSKPGDLDSDVALVEAGCGAQLVQDIVVAILSFDVVGRRESSRRSGWLQVAKVLVMYGLSVAIWELGCFDGIGSSSSNALIAV